LGSVAAPAASSVAAAAAVLWVAGVNAQMTTPAPTPAPTPWNWTDTEERWGTPQPVCPSGDGDLMIRSPAGISFESLAGDGAGRAVRVHLDAECRAGVSVSGNVTVGGTYPIRTVDVESVMGGWGNEPRPTGPSVLGFQERVHALSAGASALKAMMPKVSFQPQDKAALSAALQACADAEVPEITVDSYPQAFGDDGLGGSVQYFMSWNLWTGEGCTAPSQLGEGGRVPLSKWDVSLVTDMDELFLFAHHFTSSAIASWNVSGVTSMNQMFESSGFTSSLNAWDTGNVQSMNLLFSGSAFDGDISSWNTASVTRMEGTFAYSTFNQDISGWNTSSVFSMLGMFQGNPVFAQNLSSWDTSGVYIWSDIFHHGCTPEMNCPPTAMVTRWGCNEKGPLSSCNFS